LASRLQYEGIIAEVKHFAANNQENDPNSINEVIDERTLVESSGNTLLKEGILTAPDFN
jgi:beta-glucosidase-like glycosyl hydrolase